MKVFALAVLAVVVVIAITGAEARPQQTVSIAEAITEFILRVCAEVAKNPNAEHSSEIAEAIKKYCPQQNGAAA